MSEIKLDVGKRYLIKHDEEISKEKESCRFLDSERHCSKPEMYPGDLYEQGVRVNCYPYYRPCEHTTRGQMSDEKLIEKIIEALKEPLVPSGQLGQTMLAGWRETRPHTILTIIKEAGYVKMAEDQTLPDNVKPFFCVEPNATYFKILLDAGWRKVVWRVNEHQIDTGRDQETPRGNRESHA